MREFLADAQDYLPILFQGVQLTVLITLASLVVSTVLGLFWAVLRVSGIAVLAGFSAVMINILRGIPIIVQLFYIYFVLPDFGLSLTAVQAAIIGLGIAYSAYQAENFRAGIEAVDRGQVEAALSIGMGWWMTMRRVILPQAVKIALPPYGNIMIMMLKDSSQASTITVAETGPPGQAHRLLDVQEHQRLHDGGADVPGAEPSADPAGAPPRSEGAPPVIVLQDVHKHYGSLEVIKGVSAEVTKGEVVCIIGPSGSGKSTLLRCINGLEAYDGGEIRVDGQRVDRDKRSIQAVRTRVSMVFQRFNLFANRTALENVVEGPIHVKREPRAEVEDRARALLARVGLAGKEHARPDALSGGQQQRVAIARALAMRPEAILFDEPTSALDPELVGDVLRVMRGLADEGMTMIVVTHEIGFAREVADRVLFLDGGRLVEQGPAAEILNRPQHPRTQDFLQRVLHPL